MRDLIINNRQLGLVPEVRLSIITGKNTFSAISVFFFDTLFNSAVLLASVKKATGNDSYTWNNNSYWLSSESPNDAQYYACFLDFGKSKME